MFFTLSIEDGQMEAIHVGTGSTFHTSSSGLSEALDWIRFRVEHTKDRPLSGLAMGAQRIMALAYLEAARKGAKIEDMCLIVMDGTLFVYSKEEMVSLLAAP